MSDDHAPLVSIRPLIAAAARSLGLVALLLICASSAASPASAATSEDNTKFTVSAGSLSFSTLPGMPTLTSVTLNGAAQTTNTTMTNFGVDDATGSGAGWNTTVEGQSGTGKSAVFAQYCPKTKCGSDSEGYVGGGQSLAANSLTLNSTGASFVAQGGTTGTAPTLQCSTACNVDHPTAVKIASAATSAGLGTWLTSGFTSTSLALSTPSTLKLLSNEEVYRINLLWTLSTGP